MKNLITALFLIFTAFSFAVTKDKPSSISLERTICYGSCPSYIVTLFANGRITFKGRQYVKKKGFFKKKIAAAKFLPLFAKIEENNFWNLEDNYLSIKHPNGTISTLSDMPTTYVTVKTSNKTKKVEDYNGTPVSHRDLEKLIDERAGVSEWLGK